MKKLNLVQKFKGLTTKKKAMLIGGFILFGLLIAPVESDMTTTTPAPEEAPKPVVENVKAETEQEKAERIEREKKKIEENKIKEEEKVKKEEEEKVAQAESNKLVKMLVETTIKDNMGDMYKGIEYSNGINIIKLSTKGLAMEFVVNDKNSEARNKFREQMKSLSKSVQKVAKENGSNETYSIFILNDINEDNVLMSILDGVVVNEA